MRWRHSLVKLATVVFETLFISHIEHEFYLMKIKTKRVMIAVVGRSRLNCDMFPVNFVCLPSLFSRSGSATSMNENKWKDVPINFWMKKLTLPGSSRSYEYSKSCKSCETIVLWETISWKVVGLLWKRWKYFNSKKVKSLNFTW